MIEFAKGYTVPYPEKIKEEYQQTEYGFIANLTVEKIQGFFQSFIQQATDTPLFFILELPCSIQKEKTLSKKRLTALHKDIYYIDCLTQQQCLDLLSKYGYLLIHDGICQFGFGLQNFSSEIMMQKYNVISLWTKQPEQYRHLFEVHTIPQTDQCTTAWDTFSAQTPGNCTQIQVNGLCVYDLPNILKPMGIYQAKVLQE